MIKSPQSLESPETAKYQVPCGGDVVGVLPAAARQISLNVGTASKPTISIASTHNSRKRSERLRVRESSGPVVDFTTLRLLDSRLRLRECAPLKLIAFPFTLFGLNNSRA